MRTMMVLLAAAAVGIAVLVACRTRDDSAVDSATGDGARANESAPDSGGVASDAASPPISVARGDTPRARPPVVRRAEDPPRDSTLPPEDSIRAMRPELPQVSPVKRPRTWRGFKLPEELPVRAPLETTPPVEQAPDTVMKGDSTKPPKPAR